MLMTLEKLSERLQAGNCSAVELLQDTFSACTEPSARHVFTRLDKDAALQQAEQVDALREAGKAPSPWAGIPITVKDLFDIEGQVTLAGSKALADRPAATNTAAAIQRLISAGFVIAGKVNMTEFAYSGLGLNPHYGTPVNPWSGDEPLIPGGSSSGGAVSVALGLVAATIGTDTGGSVRIPASLCNLTGFKPASTAVSAEGVVPLAESLDSIGPLTNSVACCAVMHHIMSGGQATESPPGFDERQQRDRANPAKGLRFLVPENSIVWRDTDAGIVSRSESALQRLQEAGVELISADTPFFDQVLDSGVQGVLAGFESARWHRELMASSHQLYDPRVISRIENGVRLDESLYRDALKLREEFKKLYRRLMGSYDAVIWPTTACSAPAFSDLESDEDYSRRNLQLLRNTSVGNVLDAAALTLPLPAERSAGRDALPAGLMLQQSGDRANDLLVVGSAVETIVRG